jgi:hypothetical protein
MEGYRSRYVNKTGKRSIVFNTQDGFVDLPVTVPCGRCKGCRLEYSRQWAIRCIHEASMHEKNSFITLTYNEKHLPENLSLDKDELQRFFKRLRKETGQKFRYFACGEYGSKNHRPHYHAIIFGLDFITDNPETTRRLWSKTKNGDLLYRSPILEKTWKLGFTTVGEVTFESAAYVARYVMKKRKGDKQEVDDYYKALDTKTGEIHNILPEFCIMSRGSPKNDDFRFKRGIGHSWLEKFKGDTEKDFITVNKKKMSLPKYYDTILEQMGEDIEKRKIERKKKLDKEDNTYERLRVKEKVKDAQIKQLERNLEEL